MSSAGGVRREPISSPVVKGVTIDRLDGAVKQLIKNLVVKNLEGKYLRPEELSAMIWTKL
jgi:hypothetical protein